MKEKYQINNIMFSPEFLREGKALYDNLYPSRIIVGDKKEKGLEFAKILKNASLKKDVPIKLMNSTDAEAVKLFANTYLALRISYFNELDTYAGLKKLNTKDTKQLLANYKNIPQTMIKAIVKSNEVRKKHIANMIIKDGNRVIGIYRLTMKSGSDNFRESAIKGILEELRKQGFKIIIYEPMINTDSYEGFEVEKNFDDFIKECDTILANRLDSKIEKVTGKVYTRDIYSKD